MKFALCNEMFADADWSHSLEITRQCGYTGWEIAPFTLGEKPTQLNSAERDRISQQVTSADVEVVGLHWLLAKTSGYHLTTADQLIRKKTAEYLAELTTLCRDLGGGLMVLGSPLQRNFNPAEMSHQQATDNAIWTIEQMLPQLEKHQVTLALEPLGPGEGNFWNHAAQVVAVLERIKSPWVRLHLDIKAMSSEGTPIEKIVRDNSQWTHHFHANDPNLLGPGMGAVPIEPIFEALVETNYSGWVSVEVFDYKPGAEVIARQSMQNMLAALAKCKSAIPGKRS
jgi:sugar phosphate isomerase/epimerase